MRNKLARKLLSQGTARGSKKFQARMHWTVSLGKWNCTRWMWKMQCATSVASQASARWRDVYPQDVSACMATTSTAVMHKRSG